MTLDTRNVLHPQNRSSGLVKPPNLRALALVAAPQCDGDECHSRSGAGEQQSTL